MINPQHPMVGAKIDHPQGVGEVIAVYEPKGLPAACWVLLDGSPPRYRGCDLEDAEEWQI